MSELVASDAGLGYLMTYGRSIYDSSMVLAAALTMVSIAVIAYLIVAALEHILIDWDG